MDSPAVTVDRRVQSALTKREVANLMPRALEVMESALESDSETLAVSAAKYIIDQSVGKASQEITGGASGSGALAEAAANALNKLLETHPGLKGNIEEIPLMLENPDTGVFEIGDPEQ